ncbi:GLPGLI family protein [Chryseobacterium shandongense]|uniref:GLPGLI family protein n=1 Tax=Chryseobacterium shandongense TaxID=1493872 RepID=A0AAD1DLS2_9FLAO|nr:GLPGLI family protein [Chryseobacterium shandongense]AZA86943.1 GLPGLI family protein [Chryseobacterium shandongense]
MRKLALAFILLYSFCFGQKMSFFYDVKYRLNKEIPDQFISNIMILDLVDKNSIFRERIDRNADSLKMNNSFPMLSSGFENQFYVKKDLSNSKISKIITNGQFNYLLPIHENLKWNIYSEKKKIGIYNCQKAKTAYGDREWTAWFTNDIPVNDGPYIFHDLPGLIITITDNDEDYNFNLIQIKKSANLFDARVKPIIIDWNKYKELASSYYQNPNEEMEQKIRNAKKVIMQDANGNVIDFDIRKMNRDQQEDIRRNNNPIELNHKIDYDKL